MKKPFVTLLLIAFVFFGALSCSDSGESCASDKNDGLVPSSINPNGDSELALLMRAMFDDGMRIKEQIKQGVTPTLVEEFKQIHTAQPTPGKEKDVNTPTFKAFATAYLDALESLKNLSNDHPEKNVQKFNHLVSTCMNCHKAVCPGPMVRIKKLYLPEEG